MNTLDRVANALRGEELELLRRLRAARRARKRPAADTLTFGARVADAVAATMGSWPFSIGQSIVLLIWIVLNVTAYVEKWDPYPFILLNLALSFQAAYAAPFIMMSQNRQAAIDRVAATHDYDVNTKAELEIELLHQKIDLMREKEIGELLQVIRTFQELLARRDASPLPAIPPQAEPGAS